RRYAGEHTLHCRVSLYAECPLLIQRRAPRCLFSGETSVAFAHSIRHLPILAPPAVSCDANGAKEGQNGRDSGGTMDYSVKKTEDEWRAELGDEQYAVLRQAATERAWTGELLDEKR